MQKWKWNFSWVHIISSNPLIQVQFPASLGHLVGTHKPFWWTLVDFPFSQKGWDWGNFYLVSSFIGTAGWHFSNKTNHDRLALLQTFIFLMHPPPPFFNLTTFFGKNSKKFFNIKRGKKIKTFSVAYKIHLLFISRHFFGCFWTATASVLPGYLRLFCALNFLPFIAETLWVWFSNDKAKNIPLLVTIFQVFWGNKKWFIIKPNRLKNVIALVNVPVNL